MATILENLKLYFLINSEEQIKNDWAESEKYDKVGFKIDKNIMTKKAKELIFISSINRDGCGTQTVSEEAYNELIQNKFSAKEDYKILRLSMSQNTYLAVGFNSYVVKLR